MRTRVGIEGNKFTINGQPVYPGVNYGGHPVEGLLFNVRVVQATFDDENADSVSQWAYPDTGVWSAERNVDEFITALPEYVAHGVKAVTLNLQGGMPVTGTERAQPWINSAFAPDGSLKEAYLERLQRILTACDELGVVVILGYFYFGQDELLNDEQAVVRAVDEATAWLLDAGYENVLVEIANECDVPLYEHEILRPDRVYELVQRVKDRESAGRRLLTSVSLTNRVFRERRPVDSAVAGSSLAWKEVSDEALARILEVSDFVLFHTNSLDPEGVTAVCRNVNSHPVVTARPKPLCINEDSTAVANLDAAFPEYVPWGYYDQGKNNYRDGFQSPPVNWEISTPEKRAFFDRVAEITRTGAS